MQQQFAPAENTTPSDTSYQVTPQEFARATVEAETQPLSRREAKRASRLGEPRPRTTFTDGAGHDFTINATAQELLDEVQAYRTVKHRNIAMSPFRRKELSWWLLLGGFLASSAAVVGLTFLMYTFVRQYDRLLVDYIKQQQKLANIEQAQRNASALRPLSQIADNQPVYARYTDLIALANGTSPNQVFVANTQGKALPGSPQWMLLKSNGSYVVRGWRFAGDYIMKLKTTPNEFASIETQPGLAKQYDVPLSFFQNQVLLPTTANHSTETGEVIEMPDTL